MLDQFSIFSEPCQIFRDENSTYISLHSLIPQSSTSNSDFIDLKHLPLRKGYYTRRRERNNNREEDSVLVNINSDSFTRVKIIQRGNGNLVNMLFGQGVLHIFEKTCIGSNSTAIHSTNKNFRRPRIPINNLEVIHSHNFFPGEAH